MSRRIEVELTSARDDGTWTWRAAGAKQPKGELDAGLLYPGAKVGDVVRADADFAVEGISILAVQPPKGARPDKVERLEILGPPRRDEGGVTTQLVGKGRRDRGERGDRGDRRDRGDRNDRGDRRGPRGDGDRGRRPRGDRPEGGERRGPRPDRPARPAPEPRPKAPRLRAGRTHRNAVLNAVGAEHRPLAELLLRGGIPEVRQALDRQNALLKGEGKTPIAPEPIMDLAERLMPALRAAEWRDKAEAAVAQVDEADLRDLRSVVAASDAAGRDEDARALADQLRRAVDERVDREHAAWLAELTENLDEGRLVRALRLSSRPPKAGAPFPAELAERLAAATSEGLTAEITADRFSTIVEALAFSPVRLQVTAASVPAKPSPELLTALKKSAGRVPQLAAQFGLTTAPA